MDFIYAMTNMKIKLIKFLHNKSLKYFENFRNYAICPDNIISDGTKIRKSSKNCSVESF